MMPPVKSSTNVRVGVIGTVPALFLGWDFGGCGLSFDKYHQLLVPCMASCSNRQKLGPHRRGLGSLASSDASALSSQRCFMFYIYDVRL